MKANDIENLRKVLEERKKQIEKNLRNSVKDLEELNEQELKDEGDLASISTNNMVESAILEQQRSELVEINLALNKVRNGSFGVCEMCEDDIAIARLRVKPHARYCITCREIIEKNRR